MDTIDLKVLRHILILGSLVLLVSLAKGQNKLLFNTISDTSFQNASGAFINDVGASFRSNTLDNSIMRKLVLGGMISPEQEANGRSTLAEQNRAGGQGLLNFHYLNFDSEFGKNGQFGWMLNLSTDYHLKLDFPGTLYELIFDGNSNYLGQEMRIEGIGASFMAYQKLGTGVFHKKNLSFVSLSYVNGQDFVRAGGDGTLYTSAIGDSLSFDYSGFIEQSDPDNAGAGRPNGSGVSLDARLNIPFGDDAGFVRIELKDVGGIWWNDKSIAYESKEVVSYTGIEINDFLDQGLADVGIPNFQDSISTTETKGSIFTGLSGSYMASILSKQESGNYLELGITMKMDNTALPMVHGSYHYMLDKSTSVFARATVGGYGRLRLGAGFEKYWKGWYISAQTGDLPGLILDDLRGRGAWFSFGRFFKTK